MLPSMACIACMGYLQLYVFYFDMCSIVIESEVKAGIHHTEAERYLTCTTKAKEQAKRMMILTGRGDELESR